MTKPLLLSVYRVATRLAEPAGPRFLRWRLGRGKEDPARIGERLGRAGLPRPDGPLVWLHGASVGEGVALLPLVEALAAGGHRLLVTTGTVNSARVLAGRLPEGTIHQFAPLDLPGAVRRFVAHWRPALAVFAESELWPNMLGELDRAGVPFALVNARMSARSARRWIRVRGTIGALLGKTALCLCQTEEDAARYDLLGARGISVMGLLKFDVPAPPVDPAAAAAFAVATGARPLWVAASTHESEEPALLAALLGVRDRVPGSLTIVVPRQPDRGPPLAEEARRRGIATALRSRGERPDTATELYVADTLGELGLFYGAAPVVFVGRSLVAPGGGQNPIEPAKLGCAVLHGPHVSNFAETYAAFDAAGGAIAVADPAALAEAVAALFGDPERLARTARSAAEVAASHAGATARTLAALAPLLPDAS